MSWFSNPPAFVEFSDRHRDHHRAKLSYFAGDARGSHQLDAGLEYHKLRGNRRCVSSRPGGYVLEYLNNDYWDDPWPDGDGDGLVDLPFRGLAPRRRPPAIRSRARATAGAPSPGRVAADRRSSPFAWACATTPWSHTNTVGETVADFEKWLPRVGLAWDVGGRGRHVLRAGWSRYMHPGVTSLAMVWCRGSARATSRSTTVSTSCAVQLRHLRPADRRRRTDRPRVRAR